MLVCPPLAGGSEIPSSVLRRVYADTCLVVAETHVLGRCVYRQVIGSRKAVRVSSSGSRLLIPCLRKFELKSVKQRQV